MLRILKFQIGVPLAYPWLVRILKELIRDPQASTLPPPPPPGRAILHVAVGPVAEGGAQVSQIAWSLLNDVYKSQTEPLVQSFEPRLLALSCVCLALKLLQVNLSIPMEQVCTKCPL